MALEHHEILLMTKTTMSSSRVLTFLKLPTNCVCLCDHEGNLIPGTFGFLKLLASTSILLLSYLINLMDLMWEREHLEQLYSHQQEAPQTRRRDRKFNVRQEAQAIMSLFYWIFFSCNNLFSVNEMIMKLLFTLKAAGRSMLDCGWMLLSHYYVINHVSLSLF